MMLLLFLALGLLLVGTVLLVVGADWFLDGAGDLARALGVSALVLGVLLAGLEPEEMLTAAIASARGAPALAVGNVIGTNVTMVTVALGLSALIFPMTISVRVRRQALIATLVSIIPIVLLFLGAVTQLEGVFLLVVFVGYTLFLFRTDREAMKRMTEAEAKDDDDGDEDQQPHARPRLRWKPVLLTFAGLAAMAIGGPAIVEGALRLAQIIGLGQGAVGATIVSLGTGAEMIRPRRECGTEETVGYPGRRDSWLLCLQFAGHAGIGCRDSLHSRGPPGDLRRLTGHGGSPSRPFGPRLVWEDLPCHGWPAGSRLRRLPGGRRRAAPAGKLIHRSAVVGTAQGRAEDLAHVVGRMRR